jgi:hypothetical protein
MSVWKCICAKSKCKLRLNTRTQGLSCDDFMGCSVENTDVAADLFLGLYTY